SLFYVWKGGMSFHGGLIGVMLGLWLFARQNKKTFFEITDFVAPLGPLGLGFVRCANFVNGELWGRNTDGWYGMVFPSGGPNPRHPSQLYEAFLEGFLLFAVLWWFSSKPRNRGMVSGFFCCWYGSARFLVEFVRQPDSHIGFVAFQWMSMGQLLSTPMILGGAALLVLGYKGKLK
ncbi:MAG: phosphatidylglycerol:prolipoprotein diacylglycerol transferase, partial [Pseudoalteromonas tetraodonis]